MQINNNCILISIQPKWTQLIGNGLKTIEVRKNIPKLKPPFKCYIYCTKSLYEIDNKYIDGSGNDIIIRSRDLEKLNAWDQPCNGMVIGEFICNGFQYIETKSPCYIHSDILDTSCLTANQIRDYANGADMLYGWMIEDVKLYNKPKRISEFKQTKVIRGYHKNKMKEDVNIDIDYLLHSKRLEVKHFERAPQSWCYCNELSEA